MPIRLSIDFLVRARGTWWDEYAQPRPFTVYHLPFFHVVDVSGRGGAHGWIG